MVCPQGKLYLLSRCRSHGLTVSKYSLSDVIVVWLVLWWTFSMCDFDTMSTDLDGMNVPSIGIVAVGRFRTRPVGWYVSCVRVL